MALTLITEEERLRAELDGELTIFTAAEWQDELFGLLNHHAVALDLSRITELDGCGAQLLCILLAEARRLDKTLTILASNPLVDEVGNWLDWASAGEAAGDEHHGS